MTNQLLPGLIRNKMCSKALQSSLLSDFPLSFIYLLVPRRAGITQWGQCPLSWYTSWVSRPRPGSPSRSIWRRSRDITAWSTSPDHDTGWLSWCEGVYMAFSMYCYIAWSNSWSFVKVSSVGMNISIYNVHSL